MMRFLTDRSVFRHTLADQGLDTRTKVHPYARRHPIPHPSLPISISKWIDQLADTLQPRANEPHTGLTREQVVPFVRHSA